MIYDPGLFHTCGFSDFESNLVEQKDGEYWAVFHEGWTCFQTVKGSKFIDLDKRRG